MNTLVSKTYLPFPYYFLSMTTKTKEEQQLLDEKIARIQKQDEEILRRKKVIEEDKRLAELQNAVVKLRPSTTNVSRDRTPALKPSNRELKGDFTNDDSFQEPVVYRSTRGIRARGSDRFRGQGDSKELPPPDPRSFLYDDERDAPSRDSGGKEDLRRDLNRRRRGDERDSWGGREDDNRREFQRGGRRGGGEHRMERGRRGRGGNSRNEEEAWRAERMQIDEARIQRQKAADGKWRREWDNEKIVQEPTEESRYESRRAPSSNQDQRWPTNQHHSLMHIPSDFSPRRPNRGGPRVGRGRGRLDPSELEMPLETFQIEVLQKQINPPVRSDGSFSFVDSTLKHKPETPPALAPALPHGLEEDGLIVDPNRSIECVGDSFKISILNRSISEPSSKPQRQENESRSRFRLRTSYSSQSDDDSPRDKGHRGGRRHRTPKSQDKNYSQPKNLSVSDKYSAKTTPDTLPAQNKPPIPPFRTDHRLPSTTEANDKDDSWEDVTTSGTESIGDELTSGKSSPHDEEVEEILITGMTPTKLLSMFPEGAYSKMHTETSKGNVGEFQPECSDTLDPPDHNLSEELQVERKQTQTSCPHNVEVEEIVVSGFTPANFLEFAAEFPKASLDELQLEYSDLLDSSDDCGRTEESQMESGQPTAILDGSGISFDNYIQSLSSESSVTKAKNNEQSEVERNTITNVENKTSIVDGQSFSTTQIEVKNVTEKPKSIELSTNRIPNTPPVEGISISGTTPTESDKGNSLINKEMNSENNDGSSLKDADLSLVERSEITTFEVPTSECSISNKESNTILNDLSMENKVVLKDSTEQASSGDNILGDENKLQDVGK